LKGFGEESFAEAKLQRLGNITLIGRIADLFSERSRLMESDTGTIATVSQLSMRAMFEPLVGYANSMCFKSVARIPERMASAKRLMTSPASLPRI
jgi:hypothetical protein